ncbi:MAG: hypothetical protein KAW12_03190 [Candidatus Aminicenantes bacterium]|nr:hypothetical protein [Candidatus Aminicenantes bacterium]
MKLVLVNPYIPSLSWFFYSQGMSSPPWGMLKAADELKKKHEEILVIDGQVDYEEPGVTLKRILDFDPDIVGVMIAPVLHLYTFMANAALPYHLSFLRAVKKRLPDIKTILGGLIPRQKPGSLLAKETAVDIVMLESSPLAVSRSISMILKGNDLTAIPGIAYRDNTNNPRINSIERKKINEEKELHYFVSQSEYNWQKYGIEKNLYLLKKREIYPVYPVLGMLGCPYSCTFCATPLHFPRPSSRLSPALFVDSIEQANSRHNISRFSFWDDTFTTSPVWISEVCSQIIDRQLNISWWCFGHIKWLLNNLSLLPLMRKAGCSMMWAGVESTEDSDLDGYEKGIDFFMAKEAVSRLISADILPTTSFILGNLNDNEYKTKKIIESSREMEEQGAINIYTLLAPVPGTKLYKEIHSKKALKKHDLRLYNGTRALLDYPEMTGEKLEEIFFAAYKASILSERFSKKIGRINFDIEEAGHDEDELLEGFEDEKARMQSLEKAGYLDDEPDRLAVSCEWAFAG